MNRMKLRDDASPVEIHSYQLVTGQDLERFRQRLVIELEEIIRKQLQITPKKWLRSYEVRKLLKISVNTLQRLKASGQLPYTKMGGVHYFDYEKIRALLEAST
jgi:hypothetical protein